MYKPTHECVQAALEHERENRRSERQGRIRFEQELRRLQLETAAKQASQHAGGGDGGGSAGDCAAVNGVSGVGRGAFESFPFKPIGYLHSVFSQRCASSTARTQCDTKQHSVAQLTKCDKKHTV
eukprot:366164-Chlamydomonas_euryale.AAC.2